MRKQAAGGYAALIAATIFWALGFVVIKIGMKDLPVSSFMVLRFSIAFIFLAGLLHKQMACCDKKTITGGILTGVFLFLAIWLQTAGLTYTTASRSGFITSMNIVFIPILGYLIAHKKVSRRKVLLILLVFVGLFLLNMKEQNGVFIGWNKGDLLTVLCAVFSALHIFYTGRMVQDGNSSASQIAVIQMGTIAGLSLFVFAAEGRYIFPRHILSWVCVLYAGIFATGLGFWLQAVGQRKIEAGAASLIFALEPVLTACFAYIILKETMGAISLCGAVIMVIGIVLYNKS